MTAITVSTIVDAPIDHVWDVRNNPEHITNRAFASDDRESLNATNDLRVDGTFLTNMSAKDKSFGFDITGTYTLVDHLKRIDYTMDGDDARKVSTSFEEVEGGTKVTETFDAENQNPEEMQRAGRQAILENFKKRAEATK